MMETKIFKSREDFLAREYKRQNGVSEDFARNNPDYKLDNSTNFGCWNCSSCSHCSHCSDCSGCSRCDGCSHCDDLSRCDNCSGCSRCHDCSYCDGLSRCSRCDDCNYCNYCSRCDDCSGCYGLSGCDGRSGLNPKLTIPKITNIHTKVLEAVSNEGALNMSTWHTCDTTHCRAGWVVTLAGEEGRKLEEETSTEFAAMMIYKKSSDIRVFPYEFYESAEEAMASIRDDAKKEEDAA